MEKTNSPILGKYRLYEELRRGGFGIVYRALEIPLGVDRAVKVLHPALVAA
jgi:serine/threonine protein kinase